MARLKRQAKTDKVRHKGETSYGHSSRGPNTGAWEKIWGNWAPGAREKYSREWNSGYNGPGRGTW